MDLTEARSHIVPRPFMPRCGLAVFHPSTRRRCNHTAADRFIQGNAIPHLECVRRHCLLTGGGTLIPIEVRSRVRVHTRWQPSRKAIVSRHSRIVEIQLSRAHGTSETSERSSGMETIYGTQAISEMETICGTQTIYRMGTIICGVTGKNTFSLTPQGIGIAIGTAIATTGGMVTDAPSLMERG